MLVYETIRLTNMAITDTFKGQCDDVLFICHIAGNFRGKKFSGLSLHDTFCKLNSEDLLHCHSILYYNKIPRKSFSRL